MGDLDRPDPDLDLPPVRRLFDLPELVDQVLLLELGLRLL